MNNNERYMIIGNLYKRNFSCPCGYGNYSGHTISGINDVANTDEWMIKYFVDKSIASKYSACSNFKTDFMCPNCKTIINRRIFDIKRHGFCCPICSDGVSYPNKFGRSFIQQTPAENIEFEYIRDWTEDFSIYILNTKTKNTL